MKIVFPFFLTVLICQHFSCISCKNVTYRPPIVNIGAIFAFNSTIGKVAKIAIEAAVADVNADPNVLRGSELRVQSQNSDCNALIGIVKAIGVMETEVITIIGPECSMVTHVLSQVASEFQVPLVSFAATDPNLSSLEFPFFVRTTQSDLFQMEAIAAIVASYEWRQIVVIYIDDDYGRNGLSTLGDKLEDHRCKISYKAALGPGADRTDITNLLVKVNMMESRVFVLHTNPNMGREILSVAHLIGMKGTGYVWIATDWLTSFIDMYSPLDPDTMNTMQGVIALRQHTPSSKLKKEFISRWNMLRKKETFHLNVYGLYAYDTVWVVASAIDTFLKNGGRISFSRDQRLKGEEGGISRLDALSVFDEGKTLLNTIKNVNLTGVAGQVNFDSHGYLINPAYDIINVIGTGIHTIGYWTNYTGLSIETPEAVHMKAANRSGQNLLSVMWPGPTTTKPRGWVFRNNGMELNIVVPRRVSFTAFVDQSPSTGRVRGFCIDVFRAAVRLLPYAVPYKFIPFGDGIKNPDFNALEEMVASKRFDAAVGDIVITTNRTKIVDFTQPFVESGLVIVAPVKEISSNQWAFLQPFSVGMWSVTASFFVLLAGVIWILEHRSNKEFHGSIWEQIVTAFWFSFSTLFFSHRQNTVSTLGRIVVIIWLFVVLIIQSSYTASLSSILTVQQLSSPIKGVDDLITGNEPIGFQVGSFAENYMVEELRISRKRLKALGSPEEYANALNLGPDNGGVAAVVDERTYVEPFLSTNCNFGIVGSEFTRTGWGFAFPRDSPLAVDMSIAILQLSENGHLQKLRDKWLTRRACRLETDELGSKRLHWRSFWGLFLICGLACFVSLLLYLIHMLRKFLRRAPPTTPEATLNETPIPIRSFHSFG